MTGLALIGCGAIGRSVCRLLSRDPAVAVGRIVVPAASLDETQRFAESTLPGVTVTSALDLAGSARPRLVVECAGHRAIAEHVLPALTAGVPAVVASIGALHDATILSELERAARAGGSRVTLVSGAIGAIDALAAARIGGLSEVLYTGRKPPGGWVGTAAEQVVDLKSLQEATPIFEGSAGEAARRFPLNANVAATVALAGLGLEATHARLIADPTISRNVHRLQARGTFGSLDLTIENFPLPDNPKTSALTVYSIVRAIHNSLLPVIL